MEQEDWDLIGVSAALDAGQINAVGLLERQLDRIDHRQKYLNCYVELDAGGARSAAAASDRRRREQAILSKIDGIPIAVKDNINVDGLSTRNGSNLCHAVQGDAFVVEQLRRGGAVMLGKLNMDECAIGGTNNNPHFGRAVNPWRPGFVPGGSSGGAGSAVAGGLAWAALGTDTLGSIRLPAGYCGIVGLKATHGLIPMRGIIPLSRALDHVGPMCHSVQDARLMLEIIAGQVPEGWSASDQMLVDLSGLSVGVLEGGAVSNCETDVAEAFARAVYDVADCGANIVEMSLPKINPRSLRRAAFLMIEADGAEVLAESLRDTPEAYSNDLKMMLNYGRNLTVACRQNAREQISHAKQAFKALFEHVDLLAVPTAPQTAFPFDVTVPTNQAEITGFANITGGPALSMPCGLSSAGLPLAFQLMASPFKEAKLLGAAEVLEKKWGRLSPSL